MTLSCCSVACAEAVQATLDEVLAEVTALEAEGHLTPDARVVCADESDEDEEPAQASPSASADLADPGAAVLEAEQRALSAEEAIATLRGKIERLGPVNMMAIEQYDELEARHVFLTTQRKEDRKSVV